MTHRGNPELQGKKRKKSKRPRREHDSGVDLTSTIAPREREREDALDARAAEPGRSPREETSRVGAERSAPGTKPVAPDERGDTGLFED